MYIKSLVLNRQTNNARVSFCYDHLHPTSDCSLQHSKHGDAKMAVQACRQTKSRLSCNSHSRLLAQFFIAAYLLRRPSALLQLDPLFHIVHLQRTTVKRRITAKHTTSTRKNDRHKPPHRQARNSGQHKARQMSQVQGRSQVSCICIQHLQNIQ